MRKYWGLFLACILLSSCGEDKQPAAEQAQSTTPKQKSVYRDIKKYGFDLNDFHVVEDTIRKGDIFGELMTRNKVDYPKIYQLTQKFKDTFDVRRIRVGNAYTILASKDTTQAAQVFIYENDPINYTIVDFRDTVLAYRGKKKVKLRQREASGVIPQGGSLSNVIVDQKIDYMMVNELSGIYAWTIDFFKLDAGDKFRIIYDEKYINDSIYAGAGNIKAAYFEHRGEPFYAFAYENDSLNVMEYYDQEANNLRRTFLRAPLKFGRLSSRYNLKRKIRYYGYKVRPHKGTDYAAPIGTPILATADGVVTESTRKGGNGKYVKIRHNGTFQHLYSLLQQFQIWRE